LRVGVDEAGLGPTLGPLLIGAFASEGPEDLLAALGDCVGPPGSGCAIEIGDSKRIYSGSNKLARLERSVLACWMWAMERQAPPTTARELLASVQAPSGARAPDLRAPWYRDLDEPLPVACHAGELLEATAALRARAKTARVVPLGYRADLISAAQLNSELAEEIERGGSKNTWVVSRTLALAEEMTQLGTHDLARVVCDKAGGRNNYRAPLERAFPEHLVELREQTRQHARYDIHGLLVPGPAIDLSFLMKADDLEARVSIAACLAKYLRELSMRAFNRHFARLAAQQASAPPRPTAGYPQDARRFIDEVAPLAAGSDLPRSRWIRCR
jgi:ribonuclease HII